MAVDLKIGKVTTGGYEIKNIRSKNRVEVTLNGFFNVDHAHQYLADYQKEKESSDFSKYDIVFDCTDLKPSQMQATTVLSQLFLDYKKTFKRMFIIPSKEFLTQSQVKRTIEACKLEDFVTFVSSKAAC